MRGRMGSCDEQLPFVTDAHRDLAEQRDEPLYSVFDECAGRPDLSPSQPSRLLSAVVRSRKRVARQALFAGEIALLY